MRVLVTGLGSFWGSHLAQKLETMPDVEMIVGLDTHEPRLPLERTEFVKADSNYSILDRIVRATEVDTILHTHLIVDSTTLPGRAMHEINVIGTMNLLAARVPALVWPFAQNREQRLRAARLEAMGALQLLRDADLEPSRLAALMDRLLERPGRPETGLDLEGAQATARWIDAWRPAAGGGRAP